MPDHFCGINGFQKCFIFLEAQEHPEGTRFIPDGKHHGRRIDVEEPLCLMEFHRASWETRFQGTGHDFDKLRFTEAGTILHPDTQSHSVIHLAVHGFLYLKF